MVDVDQLLFSYLAYLAKDATENVDHVDEDQRGYAGSWLAQSFFGQFKWVGRFLTCTSMVFQLPTTVGATNGKLETLLSTVVVFSRGDVVQP